MSVSLQIYHRLPPWARNVAATVRGYYLNSWRYDSNTEDLVMEILERDYWDEMQWKSWQESRLAFVLERAATKVPYYREMWAQRRRKGDNSSWNYLENWPLLNKQTIRANAEAFVADDCRLSKMFKDHTGGTTGSSLDLWLTGDTVKYWYALCEARWRRWYGISRKDRWAIFGGQLVTPNRQENPPFWVWNAGMNQLYLSSYHIAPDSVPFYLSALVKYRVRYIWGYSSAIYALAREMVSRKRKDIELDVVLTNSEPLFDYQRKVISEAFNCPVRETYGMAEVVAAASECEKENLHSWPDTGIIEVGPDARRTEESGEFVCTGLVNADMPLIRYCVGDHGSFSDQHCECGRTLPLLKQIDGRSDDLLYTKEGRRVGQLSIVFSSDLPEIVEAQIIQTAIDKILVNIVPAEGFDEPSTELLTERLRHRMGDVDIKFERMSRIPREKNGKFRSVICQLSEDEKSGM